MITRFKLFKNKFKVGDYIKIKDKSLKEYNKDYYSSASKIPVTNHHLFKFAKIVKIIVYFDNNIGYDTEAIFLSMVNTFQLSSDDIERKLTKKEIEEFELEKDITKYNL